MACTDVQTIQAGNGTKTQFSFDFPYIFKSEIHVYFWNAVTKEYDEKLTTDATYPWRITDANPTIVEFTGAAPPSPATPVDPGEPTVDNVKIRRITQVDDIRALFNPGSAIRSDDLNKNFEQLRYAIQESGCQGISDELDQYLKDYYWDRYDNTLYSGDPWVSNDTKIATTAALDARFQDEVNDTFTKTELAVAGYVMPANDVAVPTTGAINDYINEVITNDIGSTDGVSITDDGDGTITIGLTDNSVDFDKIKDSDQIKLADQQSDYDNIGSDNKIFTSRAAVRRFENYVQNSTPSLSGMGKGAVWLDVEDDKTLSMWNGSAWIAVTSGGTFTNQPKVVYVDATAGDNNNDGHRISRPKQTIKAAIEQINNDSTYGDGSIVSVAPGIYAETLPIDITKNDVGIIGQSLRTCIIHPKIPDADQASYNVNTPHSQELQTMFRVNSGSYFANLTLMGLKAEGTRGASGSLYPDTVHGLPPQQGWNFAFYPDAIIKKSPYVQNCTNFSDSQINNVAFTPHTPGEGSAGDLDSSPCGGGILVDGSVPNTNSPLRSMVCDSYTHTALDGPGIFVTNNGYVQATSSYAFFNHAHITCINGGQANLAASTTDFGRYGLVVDGKSSTAIFTSNVDGAAADKSITFNINEPTAGAGWFGSTERPAENMLVEVNSILYPILSATPYTDSEGGDGWTVSISRPNPSNRSENLGLNGAIADDAAVSFYLRSMISSSGHTMEYVGSGTDYRALPENGGVPIDASQIIEKNDGKVWTAITDHNGMFKVGDFFTVDQRTGFVSIAAGSIAADIVTDLTPELGGELDALNNGIINVGGLSVTGELAGTQTPEVRLTGANPTIALIDNDSSQADFYIQGAANRFYIKSDTDGDGTLDSDELMEARPEFGTLSFYGRQLMSNGELFINGDGKVAGDLTVYGLDISNNSVPAPDPCELRRASGDYGTVKVGGSSTGGWKGYAIEDGAVFMQKNDNTEFGLYDDTNNHWALRHIKNAGTKLYYDGSEKLTTSPTGGTLLGTWSIGEITGASNITGANSTMTIQPADSTTARTLHLRGNNDTDGTGGAVVVGHESRGNTVFRTGGVFKFAKPGQTSQEGTLNFDNITSDRIYTFPNAAGTIALTSSTVDTATNCSRTVGAGSGLTGGGTLTTNRTLNVGEGSGINVTTDAVSVDSTVVRTTGNQTMTGNKTFSNTVNIREALDLADGDQLRFGASDDWVASFDSNGWLYVNQKGAGMIFQDNGTNKMRLEDSGVFRPEGDGGGSLGTTGARWGNLYTNEATVTNVLNVRGAIDLHDNDIIRFGNGDDCEMFTNGSHMYMDLNSGIGNFYIRDGTTTRFTFNDNGDFSATGTISGTFSSGNVKTAIASSTAGQTGTYAFCTLVNTTGDKTANTTTSGSTLRYSNANGNQSGTPGGSWRLLGRLAGNSTNTAPSETSLWVRYA